MYKSRAEVCELSLKFAEMVYYFVGRDYSQSWRWLLQLLFMRRWCEEQNLRATPNFCCLEGKVAATRQWQFTQIFPFFNELLYHICKQSCSYCTFATIVYLIWLHYLQLSSCHDSACCCMYEVGFNTAKSCELLVHMHAFGRAWISCVR